MQRKRLSIALSVVAIVTPLMLGCGAAQQKAPTEDAQADTATTAAPEKVEYLFVQTAQMATISDGVLIMGSVSPATIYFSDRPERVAGHMTTEEFIANWGEGDNSFASNPPNATLSILTGPEPQEIVVVLTEPKLDDGNLVYNIEILEGATETKGGAGSLFIDIIGMPLTPVSYAGVARRTTRRAVLYR